MEDICSAEFKLFRELIVLQLNAAIEAKSEDERLEKIEKLREALDNR